MPYIFPKRRLRDEDVLDPVELNEDFVPAAELYSGNLDRHNFKDTLNLAPKSDNANAKSGYFNHYYTSTQVDPNFGTFGSGTSSYSYPNTTAANGDEYVIPATQSWSVIDSLSISPIKTGVSVLWINAYVQYIWLGWMNESSYNAWSLPWSDYGVLPALVQVAIRVDGTIIPSTITGHENPFERISHPWRWAATRSNFTLDTTSGGNQDHKPGPVTGYDLNVSGVGPELFPVRVGTHIPVTSGTHSVDVVVRRLQPADRILTAKEAKLAPSGFNNDIVCFNRQLHVTELPMHPVSSTTYDSVTVTTFDTEDTISASKIGASNFDALVTKFNDVQNGALARGALTNQHLKSGVLDSDQTEITPSIMRQATAKYPGYGVNTFAGGRAGMGWWRIDDGAGGTILKTKEIKVSEPCYILVFANLHVRAVTDSDDINTYIQSIFGAFAIGYKTGGSVFIKPESEAYVHNFNIDDTYTGPPGADPTKTTHYTSTVKALAEHVDVAVMAVFDHTDGVAKTYTYFGLYGSAMAYSPGTGSGTPTPQIRWRRGNISVLVLRA